MPWLKRLVIGLLVVIVLAGLGGYSYAQLNPGPRQPIPFSHRGHAGLKEFSCYFCHPDADRGPYPGMPPVEKCLLCHKVIIPQFEPIQRLDRYAREGKGVPWVRVNVVADFVHFNHQIHVLRRGFDCSRCHGDVKHMDRVYQVQKFSMGFCVDCHKQNGGPTDCFVCHR